MPRYVASRGAIVALTRSMAPRGLGPYNINVNSIAPLRALHILLVNPV